MARYKDVENYRNLFDEEYKKTRELIFQGETHLDNLAEGFTEAGWVIDRIPTADVVPKSEAEEWVDKCREWHKVAELKSQCIVELDEGLAKANQEVAREIFEEIEKEIDMNLSVISKILNAKGGRSNGKTILISKYDVFIEAKKHLAKLKKKYTEGNNEES